MVRSNVVVVRCKCCNCHVLTWSRDAVAMATSLNPTVCYGNVPIPHCLLWQLRLPTSYLYSTLNVMLCPGITGWSRIKSVCTLMGALHWTTYLWKIWNTCVTETSFPASHCMCKQSWCTLAVSVNSPGAH